MFRLLHRPTALTRILQLQHHTTHTLIQLQPCTRPYVSPAATTITAISTARSRFPISDLRLHQRQQTPDPHPMTLPYTTSRTPVSDIQPAVLHSHQLHPLHHHHRHQQRRYFSLWHNPFTTKRSPQRIEPADISNPSGWGPQLGLFGCPLRSPSDFGRLEERVIQLSQESITRIQTIQPPNLTILTEIDMISNLLCSVIDVAELCKNVHANEEWREAAAATSARLGSFMSILNHSQILYQAISSLTHSPDYSNWNEETRRVAMLLKRDMDAQGIGSSESDRNRIQTLMSEIHEQTFRFSSALFQWDGQRTATLQLKHPTDMSDIPREWLPLVKKISMNQITVPLAPALEFLPRCPNDLFRQQMYQQFYDEHILMEQKSALIRIVSARQELARTLGRESYAAHTVSLCVAGDDQHVRRLLTKMLEGLQPNVNTKTAEEMATLQREKYLHTHQLSPTIQLTPNQREAMSQTRLSPSDHLFYTSRVRSQLFSPTTSHALSHYFSVPNVLNGWSILVDRLFGLELRSVRPEPNESWANTPKEELIKMELWEPIKDVNGLPTANKKLLGILYADIYARPNKYSNAASFTIRSGCTVSGQRQLPVVGLVISLPRPTHKSAIHPNQLIQVTTPSTSLNTNDPSPISPSHYTAAYAATSTPTDSSLTLISHSDVETLFHEFGHCLHHLLSSTQYQHVAGARGELDFVEMPSTLFEHFVSSHAFVSLWAKHYVTNAPIPNGLFMELIRAKHAFKNVDLIHQAILSLYDQQIYGRELSQPNLSHEVIGDQLSQLYHQLLQQYSPFHHADTPIAHPHLRLVHLTHYAASYYCYLYCRIFSSLIWTKYFTHGTTPMQRELGHKLRYQLFAPGGSKDPRTILSELAGLNETGQSLQEFVEGRLTTFIQSTGMDEVDQQ